MIILLVILLVICLYQMKISSFHDDYISKNSTDSIKGIFTVIILYSHMRGYLPPPIENQSFINILFFKVINMIGQLMVVMFLFYSGYGILESYKNKPTYKDTFFKKRFLKTLLHFDLAVLMFVALSIILENEYTFSQYALSFIGWESIGNSNWFVFDILVIYLFSNLCFIMFPVSKEKQIVWTMYALASVLLIALYFTKHGSYWYDTILAFPTGMLYSLYRNRIESNLKVATKYYISLAILAILFFILYFRFSILAPFFNGIIFPLMIVWITAKIKFDNKILRWLGLQCFAVYILQRIPMIIYTELGLNNNWILFAIAVIPTTLLLASLFTAFTQKIDKKLFL